MRTEKMDDADRLSLFLRDRTLSNERLNDYDIALMREASELIDDLADELKQRPLGSPFGNDPYALVWMAFKNLYPEKRCVCYLMPAPDGWKDGDGYGNTTFPDDGSDPIVCVYSSFPIEQQVEIFAHELAHVAAGAKAEHGKEWDDAFEAIFQEYQRIGGEMFDGGENE